MKADFDEKGLKGLQQQQYQDLETALAAKSKKMGIAEKKMEVSIIKEGFPCFAKKMEIDIKKDGYITFSKKKMDER